MSIFRSSLHQFGIERVGGEGEETTCGDVHDKAHWEDRSAEELDQPRVRRIEARRASRHDLGEETSKRKHHARRDLRVSLGFTAVALARRLIDRMYEARHETGSDED